MFIPSSKSGFRFIICLTPKSLAFFSKVLYNGFMKEYKISDINNLEQYVYELVEPKIKEFCDAYERMGFVLSSSLVPISDENDSLIRITIRAGEECFSINLCFIANGQNGGYYVSPLIKEGDVSNDVHLLLEQVKLVLLDKGFKETKELYDGVQKDAYKQNNVVHKTVKILKFIFGGAVVVAIGAILVFLITIT